MEHLVWPSVFDHGKPGLLLSGHHLLFSRKMLALFFVICERMRKIHVHFVRNEKN